MPSMYTPEQQDAILRAHGKDPDQWSLSDDGSKMMFGGGVSLPALPQDEQPQQPPTSPQQQYTPTETFVKSAIDVAPSTAAGGWAGIGTGAAAAEAVTPWAAALAPETAGLSLLIPPAVGLGTGLLTTLGIGGAAKKVQESLESDEYKRNLAAMQAEHPTAAWWGNVAALPAGGMLPSPTGLAQGLGAIPKMLAGGIKAATPEELSSLVNVGLGAGLGGGQALYQGQSGADVAKEMGIGMLFNKQWGSENSRVVADPKKYAQMLENIQTPPPPAQPAPPPGPNLLNPPGVHIDARTGTILPDTAFPPMEGMKQIGPAGPEQAPAPPTQPQLPAPPEMSWRMKAIEAAQNELKAQAEKIANEQLAGELKAGMEKGIARPEVQQGMAIISPLSKLEAQNRRESPADLEARIAEAKAAGEPKPKYQTQGLSPAAQQLMDYVKEYQQRTGKELKLNVDPNYIETIAREVSARHGIEDIAAPGLKHAETGQEVLGEALVGQRKSLINPNLADVGTQFHENFHHIWDSMTPEEQQQLKNATANDYAKFKQENPQSTADHEEFLAMESGYKSVLRSLNAAGETGLGKYWNDLKALWKTKYGAEPSAQDVLRAHEYKLVNGISDLTKMRINAGMINPAAEEQKRVAAGKQPLQLGAAKYQEAGVAQKRPQDLLYGAKQYDEKGNPVLTKEGVPILPHEGVRKYFRTYGEYPSPEIMKSDLGYTDQDLERIKNDPLLHGLITGRSGWDLRTDMRAAEAARNRVQGTPEFKQKQADYIQSIKNYFNRHVVENLYGRGSFLKTEVQDRPQSWYYDEHGNKVEFSPGGYYEQRNAPWQGRIVSRPSNEGIAAHEAMHELFTEGLGRDPSHLRELLQSLRGNPEFENALNESARRLTMIHPAYKYAEDSYKRWRKNDNLSAMNIIDEAIAQGVYGGRPELELAAHNLGKSMFGEDFATTMQRAKPRMTGEPKALAPGWDMTTRRYYQEQGLGGRQTREERNAKKVELRQRQAQEIAEIRQRQAERDAALRGQTGAVEPYAARSAGVPPTVYPQQGQIPKGAAARRGEYFPTQTANEVINNTVRASLNKMIRAQGHGYGLPAEDLADIQSRVRTTLAQEGILPHSGDVSKYPPTYLNQVSATAAMEAKRAYYDHITQKIMEGVSLQKKVGRGEGVELGELAGTSTGTKEGVSEAGETEVALKPTGGKAERVKSPEEIEAEKAYRTEKEQKAAEKREAAEKKAAEKAEKARSKGQFNTEAEILHNQFKDKLEADNDLAPNNRMPEHIRSVIEAAVEKLSKMPPRTPLDSKKFMEDIMKSGAAGKAPAGKYQRYGLAGASPNATEGQKYSFYKTRAEIDEALKKAPDSGLIYKALQVLPQVRDRMFARYFNPIAEAAKGMSPIAKKNVLDRLYNEDLSGKASPFAPGTKEAQLHEAIRKSLLDKQKDQIAAGQMVTDFTESGKPFKRAARINPTYAPSLMRSEVLNDLVEKTGKWKEYEKSLIDHWKANRMSDDEIKQRLESFRAIEDDSTPNETRFAANRLSEGVGIPAELREQRLENAFQRYFGRVAMDRSYYDTVESKGDVVKNLNDNSHAYKDIISNLKGSEFDKSENTMKAINRVFTSAMLGPITNLHIGFSSLFNPMQYVKLSELGQVYGRGMAEWSKANESAIRNGYLKRDFTSFHDIIDKNLSTTQKMGALASQIGKLGGREWTDMAAKTVAQGLSEQIVPLRLADARRGDVYSQRLIKQLDPYFTPDKQYTSQEQSQMASTLAGFIHGSHDYRTLPAWMNKESILKPFFSLMSWTTAQTNQWMKHVWHPAMQGNVQPLIMSTLGAALGGYVIQQLRQAVSDKKTNIPSLTEIAQSSRGLEGNIPLLAYNFMQMASYTGFAGLGSTVMKDIFDVIHKNAPQGAAFPADEALSSITKTASDALQAWSENPSWENFTAVGSKAVTDLVRENVQLARIASNWAADYGLAPSQLTYQKQLSDKEQALRRWRMTEGQPYEPEGALSGANTLRNLQMKQFKQTQDIGEAAGQVPSLFQLAQQRAQGNPEVLKQQLEALKQNSYQTMPSPENMPLQFAQYLQYVTRTQGPAAAQSLMMDYMRRNAINKAKEGMIPGMPGIK